MFLSIWKIVNVNFTYTEKCLIAFFVIFTAIPAKSFSQLIEPDSSHLMYNDTLLSNNKEKVMFLGIKNHTNKLKDTTRKKNIELHGTILIEGQYATRSYDYQQIPQSYLKTTIKPQLLLWGIPFTSNINLSTEQFKVNYNLNRISFSLDINKVNSILLQKLKHKATDSLLQNKFDAQQWEDSLNRLGKVEVALSVAQKTAESKKKELVAIERQSPEITDSLKSSEMKYRLAYKDYAAKQEEYKIALAVLDSLQEQKKEYERVKKLYNKLKSSGTFEVDKIAEYSSLPEKYKTHPGLTKAEKILLSIRSFNIGTINPSSSQAYLQGTSVNGISIENSFRNIYTSLQVGLLQQNISFGELRQNTTPRKYLYAVKSGWGMPENAHFHVGYTRSGTFMKNKNTNINEDDLLLAKDIGVTSFDGKLPISKSLSLYGNWAIADVKDYGIETINEGKSIALPGRFNSFNNILHQPNSYYLAGVNGDFKQTKTKITAQVTRVGASFYSPLNPYFRNDLLKKEVKVTQKLYKDYVSTSFSYSSSVDNLLNQKRTTSNLDNYKATISLRLKKLPSLTASYAIIDQSISSSENTQFAYLNRTKVITITSVYSRRIKTNVITGALSYTHQNTTNKNIFGLNRYYNNLLGNFSLSDKKGNTVSYTSSLSLLNNTPTQSHVFNNQAEASYVHPKNRSYISAGGIYYTMDNLLGDNGGLFIRQNMLFNTKTSIILLLKQNFYKGNYQNSTIKHQTIVNIQLIQQW